MKVHLSLQPAPNRTSGIGVYTHEICRRLAGGAGLELSGGFTSLRTRSVPLFDSYRFPVRFSRIPEQLLYADPGRRPLPVSYNLMMRDRSDVSVFFANRLPSASVRGRVLAVVHDLIPIRIPLELPGIAERYHRQLDDIRTRADVVVTVSEWSRRDIAADTGIPADKIEVVPNGIDAEAFGVPIDPLVLAAVRRKYGLPDRFILYFGGTRPYKNVGRLIEAYGLLPATTRSTVGLVITRQDRDLQARAKELGVADSAVFTAPIDDEDKVAVYQLAEVSVLVSLYEGFGIPVIEAMAAGTPVIASNAASLPEVCGGAALLVDPLDVEGLASELRHVLEDADLHESLVEKGFRNAARFSWDTSAALFHTLLTRLDVA